VEEFLLRFLPGFLELYPGRSFIDFMLLLTDSSFTILVHECSKFRLTHG